jgi:hypothetical protein
LGCWVCLNLSRFFAIDLCVGSLRGRLTDPSKVSV